MAGTDLFAEANRQLIICNACRYCEGLCPVFRAIETRRTFGKSDVFYLANLCHDCRACYYACMFTPPHEFGVNIPQILADARIESYKEWSWPRFFGRAFKQPSIAQFLSAASVLLVATLAVVLIGPDRLFVAHLGRGAFYAIVPYLAMDVPAIMIALFAVAVWTLGCMSAWNGMKNGAQNQITGGSLAAAISAVFGLKHLQGGGPGCTYPDERPSSWRRIYHSLVFWGFLLDFASTTLAYVYQEFLHELPPYPVLSAPVVFGGVGGIMLLIGATGLISLKLKSDQAPMSSLAYGMDYAFLVLLALTALTGILTLAFRATAALGTLLLFHLGTVAALFITAPYGKIVHAFYRTVSLIRYYAERG
jgi:citrate/tricarballylate utilization protein